MDEEAAFLRTICDQPDEDTPRLVFADWLQEQGGDVNAAWAELIRVQITLARAGADRDRLTDRDHELTRVITFPWPQRLGIPQWLRWENWSRGFPLTVSGIGSTIREARALRLQTEFRLREFNLREATDDDLEDFTTWPELQLVRKLGVWTESAWITQRGFIALAQCEYLNDLERLRMQSVMYTDAAMQAFLDSPFLSRLISVKIVGRNFSTLSADVQAQVHGRFGRWDIH